MRMSHWSDLGLRRARRFAVGAALLAALAGAGCGAPRTPVYFVPASPAAPAPASEQLAIQVLSDLGYRIARYEPATGLFRSAWRHDDGILGQRRYRAEVRFPRQGIPGAAVSVPREVWDGRAWAPDGEDEERRKELVGSMLARLSRPAT